MRINDLVRQVPYALVAYRETNAIIHRSTTRREISRLEAVPYMEGARIAHALRAVREAPPQAERAWIDKIETERRRFLRCRQPLVDGHLGEGGLYDQRETIRSACLSSKARRPAYLLMQLVRAMKPSNVVELGTNLGISSAYLAAALKLNGQGGRILTLDASPYRQEAAKQAHHNLALDTVSFVTGLFAETLEPSVAQWESVDLAFIDGHHQYQPTLDYFATLARFAAPGALFVLDDIRWSAGMKQAWAEIRSDERVGLAIDLSSMGLCVLRRLDIAQRFVIGPLYVA